MLASVSGYVYLDANGDGQRSADEVGLPGVEITISGIIAPDADGDLSELPTSTLTSDSGFYAFVDLPAGTFSVTEQQPQAASDASESAEFAKVLVGDDEFTNLELDASDTATELNFGEAAIKSEFVSILWVLSSSADSTKQGAMLREVVASAEQRMGNVELASRILNDAENGAVTEPIASRDQYEVPADETLIVTVAGGVLQNDLNPGQDPLVAELETGPENGILTLNSDGSFSYTANVGFLGIDSFTYRAVGAAASNPSLVTIQVAAPPNRTPVAQPDLYSTDEDTLLSIPATTGVLSNDEDDGPVRARLVTNANHGIITLDEDGGFEYTPRQDFFGTDSFEYVADDGQVESTPATVTIDVRAVADAPKANDDEYAINQDEILRITVSQGVLANDSDVESDIAKALLEAEVSNGTLVLEPNGAFLYTPTPGFAGTDSFRYVAVDQSGATDSAVVTISVVAVNSSPQAFPDEYQVAEDLTLSIAAPGVLENDTDSDQDPLTATIGVLPENGSVTLNADGSFSYIPESNFNGSDSFSYVVSDGTAVSDEATVTVSVTPQNDLPQANADAYVTSENELLTIDAGLGVLANDLDVDGDVLTSALVVDVSDGTLTLNEDGSFSYQPNAAFNGLDSFTYSANDGIGTSPEATVVIDVGSVNDPPVASDDVFFTDEDVPLLLVNDSVLANDSDLDDDALTAELVQEPQAGTLSLNSDGTFEYFPNQDSFGEDSFTYVASDGFRTSAPAVVTLTVRPINDLPIGNADAYEIDEDMTLSIDSASGVIANDADIDSDTLTAGVIESTQNGTLTLNENGSFEYVPNQDFHGQDAFTYAAFDGTQMSSPTNVVITVRPVNDAPIANDDSYATNEEVPLTVDSLDGVLVNDFDADSDSLVASIVDGPENGQVTLNLDGSFTYTPDEGFSGFDTFTYVADDPMATSTSANVVITVSSVNALPIAVDDDSYELDEDSVLAVGSAIGVLSNDIDADGDALNAELVTNASNGTVQLNSDGSFTYTPIADFNGTDSFTYQVSDGLGTSNEATVTITVHAVPDMMSGSVTLSASKDNSLFENPDGVISNGAGEYLFVGKTLEASSFLRRALIAFDLSSIPTGAIITKVDLTLNMSRTIVGAFDVDLHRVTNDWGEGTSDAPGQEGTGTNAAANDVTWLHTFFDGQLWNAPGGDFIATSSASTSVDGEGAYTWTSEGMVTDVQDWLDDPSTNAGWMLITDENDISAKRFDSRENSMEANRPQLFVEYVVNAAAAATARLPRSALPVRFYQPPLFEDARPMVAALSATTRHHSDSAEMRQPNQRIRLRTANHLQRRLTTTSRNDEVALPQPSARDDAFADLVESVFGQTTDWRN